MKKPLVLRISILPFLFFLSSIAFGQPANDNQAGAIDVTGIINSCSSDAAYTTVSATSDGVAASCWNTGPTYNVWFSFTAPASGQIGITVDRGGSKGSIQRVNAALWDTDGVSELECNRYINNGDDVVLGYVGLTPGATYFISVDNNYSGFVGTFTLCLSDAVDYDFYEGAIDINGIIGSCSADAAYTTSGATNDKNAGSCWNTSPNYNRWFTFNGTSTGNMKITVDRGGSKGTIQRLNVAVWEADGTTQVACTRYINNGDDIILEIVGGLTDGNQYYLSVDNNYSGFRGTFTLCLDDSDAAITYDYFAGAVDINDIVGGCSADAAYTTYGATADLNAASCWNTGPNYNRWFTFNGTSTGNMKITVDRGGSKGSIQRINAAVWEADGTTQVACQRYINNGDDVIIEIVNSLTDGQQYYLSVDNNYSGFRGSFTLCLDDSDAGLTYDSYEGAIDVTSIINSCSADAAYTTYGATSDKNAASTWNTSPNYNRWFKFTASSPAINITVDRGGSKGSVQRVNLALWEADGETEIASNRYVNNGDDVIVGTGGLVPGNEYYISVDNNYSGFRGSFTLCLDDIVDYDYYEGATTLTNLSNFSSADAIYTTLGATGDRNAASTWNTSPNYNRWFKFQATGPQISITVDRGGSRGTIQRINAAIWEADGTTEVVSNRYVNNGDDVTVNATTLTPGDFYYLSVDNNYSGFRGTFSLIIDDTPDYDFLEGAVEIVDVNNWCSSDAEYTTVGATSDQNAGSCWNTSPNYNRWFTFQAVSDGINVEVQRGGSKGSIQRINLALWEADGTTQVDCNRYVNNGDNVSVSSTSLTPGNWYYISVDNNYSGFRGTFTLCVDDSPSYDYQEGAIELTDLDNWCSADAEFTTSGATSDQSAASCWNTSPNYNRWFKFTAIHHTATIDVRRGGVEGTVQRLNVALWDDMGGEVACSRYSSNEDNIQIVQAGLTIGNEYFISVDNNYSGFRGTFTLCINNVSTDQYYAIADGDWNTPATWSLTEGGAAAVSKPTSANKVYIKGYDVTVTGTEAAATLDMEVENDNTSLTVDGGALTINGTANYLNNGFNFDGNITAVNNGQITFTTDLNATRNGGANVFGIDIETGSSIAVQNDLNLTADAGTINNTLVTINGSGQLNVSNNLTLDYNAGMPIAATLNNTSSLTVGGDLHFDTGLESTTSLTLNNTSTFNQGGNINRNGTPFGTLTFNDDATLVLNSTDTEQVLSANAGSGADSFTYRHITFNNTKVSTPQITLEGDVNVPGTLTMTSGNVSTGGFTLTLGTSTADLGTLTYTSGQIIGNYEKWINAGTTTSYQLPIGTADNSNIAQITFNDTPTGTLLATFQSSDPGSSGLPLTDGAETYYDQFTEGYWTLTAGNGLSTSDYDLTLDATGFDDYTITANTALFTRANSGVDWAVDGTAVAPVGNVIGRDNVTTLDAEFAIFDNSCIENTSSISGNTTVTEFAINQEYFVVDQGYTYNWTVVGGTIETGDGTNLIIVNWGAATTGSVSVIANNAGLCSAPQESIVVDVRGPIVSNGIGGGNWNSGSSWSGGLVPTPTDNITILATDILSLDAPVTIGDLNLQGTINNNGFTLDVTGDYTNDGTHTSSGDDLFTLSGSNTNISGSGIMNLGGRFRVTSGTKFVVDGSSLTVTGTLFIDNGITVHNNADIVLTGSVEGGNSSSTLENRSGGSLFVTGDLLATGTLVANYSNNTVIYNGSSDQDIKRPQGGEYYDLVLQGSSTTTLTGITSILGNLTNGASNTFDPDVYNFSIEGDWVNAGIFIPGTVTITLTGTNEQTLSGTFYNLTMNKPLRSLTLTADLTITNTLNLTSGTIILGANDLYITNTASTGITNGSSSGYIRATSTGRIVWDVAVGNTMLFPVGDNLLYTPFAFTLNSGTLSSASVSLNLSTSAHPGISAGTSYLNRYWTLESTGISSPNYDAVYIYDDADIVGVEADYVPHKFSASWSNGGSVDAGTNTLTWTGVTSFSDFTALDPATTTLPVELAKFDVLNEENKAIVQWITVSEVNNDFFTIERSFDGFEFEEIISLPGAGNSSELITYTYTDQPPLGYSYYRLKQTDYDGQFTYSEIKSFYAEESLGRSLTIYPNPTNGKKISLYNDGNEIGFLTIEILSLDGKKIFSREYSNISRILDLDISSHIIQTGTYILRIIGGEQSVSKRLIVR